jgi:1-acyl-sn-glycerol-3-phosphate acyltransferase
MNKILAYPFSIVFYLAFGSVLCIFHVFQVINLKLFGYKAHKNTVDVLNLFIIRCLNLLGTRIRFDNEQVLKLNRPHIIVSNHQSMYDIPPIIWYMRKLHPKFISKKELGKGIPSVSYNLRHGGSVLIDRKNSEQAVNAIKEFGAYLTKHNRSGVIFPEGTRSRNGKIKPFYENGLRALLQSCPNAVVVPVSIQNSWKLQRWGMFPIPLGTKIQFKVHQPFSAENHTFDEVYDYCLKTISAGIS